MGAALEVILIEVFTAFGCGTLVEGAGFELGEILMVDTALPAPASVLLDSAVGLTRGNGAWDACTTGSAAPALIVASSFLWIFAKESLPR